MLINNYLVVFLKGSCIKNCLSISTKNSKPIINKFNQSYNSNLVMPKIQNAYYVRKYTYER